MLAFVCKPVDQRAQVFSKGEIPYRCESGNEVDSATMRRNKSWLACPGASAKIARSTISRDGRLETRDADIPVNCPLASRSKTRAIESRVMLRVSSIRPPKGSASI